MGKKLQGLVAGFITYLIMINVTQAYYSWDMLYLSVGVAVVAGAIFGLM